MENYLSILHSILHGIVQHITVCGPDSLVLNTIFSKETLNRQTSVSTSYFLVHLLPTNFLPFLWALGRELPFGIQGLVAPLLNFQILNLHREVVSVVL